MKYSPQRSSYASFLDNSCLHVNEFTLVISSGLRNVVLYLVPKKGLETRGYRQLFPFQEDTAIH